MRVVKPVAFDVHEWLELVGEIVSGEIDGFGWGYNRGDMENTFFVYLYDHEMLVLKDKEKIVGTLAGMVAPYMGNYSTTYFMESLWCVKKGYNGLQLFYEMQKHLRARGIKKMVMGHSHSLRPELFKKLYPRLGFKLQESHYIKDL